LIALLLITFLDLGVEPLQDGLGITHEDEVVVARLDLQVSRPRSDRRFAREPVLFVFASVGDVNVAHSAYFLSASFLHRIAEALSRNRMEISLLPP
jgi:hypothetical protein